MAAISEAAFSQGDIMRRIRELENRVRELQAGRRLEAASIGRGGITVKGGSISIVDEQTGAVKIRMGKLPSDGAYDLEAVDPNGKALRLADFVFGPVVAEANAMQTTTSTSFTDLTGGPEVSVDVGATGKVLVLFACQIGWVLAAPGANAGVCAIDVSGATSIPASGSGNTDRQIAAQTEAGGATSNVGVFGVGSMKLFTGLNPGPTTFKLRYRSPFGLSVDFDNRQIAAFPF